MNIWINGCKYKIVFDVIIVIALEYYLFACSALRQVQITMAPSDPALCFSLQFLVTDLFFSCSISRSNIFFFGFPFGRFLSIFPSSTVFRKHSSLKTCPIQFAWRCLMTCIRERCFCTRHKTSSFDTCAVQLIFSILRQIHISKACIRLMSSFLSVHVSEP